MEVRKIWNKPPEAKVYHLCYTAFTTRYGENIPDDLVCANMHIPLDLVVYLQRWHNEVYDIFRPDTVCPATDSTQRTVYLYLNSKSCDLCVFGRHADVENYLQTIEKQMSVLANAANGIATTAAILLAQL